MDRDEVLPQDLKLLEQECNSSQWLAENDHEPCVGDPSCPNLAEGRGIRGMSLYTAFVKNARGEAEAHGCHFAPCAAYHTYSLEEAIRHQRDHHFNHKPFVCVPASGKQWYALLFPFLLHCPFTNPLQ
jgi:hypothetical protein